MNCLVKPCFRTQPTKILQTALFEFFQTKPTAEIVVTIEQVFLMAGKPASRRSTEIGSF